MERPAGTLLQLFFPKGQ